MNIPQLKAACGDTWRIPLVTFPDDEVVLEWWYCYEHAEPKKMTYYVNDAHLIGLVGTAIIIDELIKTPEQFFKLWIYWLKQ